MSEKTKPAEKADPVLVKKANPKAYPTIEYIIFLNMFSFSNF